MEHAHHWRATSKVFALVCDCGVAYHEALVAEIEHLHTVQLQLKTATPAATVEVGDLRAQLEEAAREATALRAQLEEAAREAPALRTQLEEARREATALRAELDEARRELDVHAKKVSSQLDVACTGSLVHDEFTTCPVHR